MSNRKAVRAPVVRLPPKSNFEILLLRSAQAAMILVGLVAFVFALHAGEFILAPVSLAIIIGLMLGPVAVRVERWGVPPGLSAALVVILFIAVVSAFALAIAAPLQLWIERLPQIWSELQLQLHQWREPLGALKGVRDQIRAITGQEGLAVSVEDGSAVESMAAFAPAFIGQLLLFFAALYFFVATRHQIRIAILKLCFGRRLRWRVAHIFRDVERLVSRYLLSISIINVAEGIAVGIGLWVIGVPSAALWGALAALSNFVVFIGPLIMTLVLFAVGLTEFDTLAGSLLPVLVYQLINVAESQFFTPAVIGKTMTLNPFVVVLALAFWIWLWGALGGFIAIPALLICYAIVSNIVPNSGWAADEDEVPIVKLTSYR
ncbi:MAG TPA: AI-2E family transporter [Rhizobiaceae bacterium]|nr:AI-2E family transporter [Rhizobiaceae bacterium]